MTGYQKKILLVGDFGVGKSSLVARFVHNRFSEEYKSTIGVVINKKTVEVDGEPVNLLVWDVAGSRDMNEVPAAYYLGSSGILYVFDLSRPETWAGMAARLDTVITKSKLPPNSDCLLVVANKSDLVSKPDLEQILADVGVKVDVVTSARDSLNVDEAFSELGRRMLSTTS